MSDKLFRYSSKLAAIITACWVLAGAVQAQDLSNTSPESEHWEFDQFTAWIPLDDAPLPSVALAQLNVALYTAKQRTAQSLCSDQWMANGPLYDQAKPSLQPLTAGHSGKQAWFYYALRHPKPVPCKNVSRVRFFREMSRHLPEWVVVRPAGYRTAFRQGGAVFPEEQHLLATR